MVLTLGESWPVLVGKRFLTVSAADRSDGGHDGWDVERVAEWPWLSGTIRAVSHADVTRKDLKVNPASAVGRFVTGVTRQPASSSPFVKEAIRKLACDLTVQRTGP